MIDYIMSKRVPEIMQITTLENFNVCAVMCITLAEI
jgi:hypothetical protein